MSSTLEATLRCTVRFATALNGFQGEYNNFKVHNALANLCALMTVSSAIIIDLDLRPYSVWKKHSSRVYRDGKTETQLIEALPALTEELNAASEALYDFNGRGNYSVEQTNIKHVYNLPFLPIS